MSLEKLVEDTCQAVTIDYLQQVGMRKESETKGQNFAKWKNTWGIILSENVIYFVIVSM